MRVPLFEKLQTAVNDELATISTYENGKLVKTVTRGNEFVSGEFCDTIVQITFGRETCYYRFHIPKIDANSIFRELEKTKRYLIETGTLGAKDRSINVFMTAVKEQHQDRGWAIEEILPDAVWSG